MMIGMDTPTNAAIELGAEIEVEETGMALVEMRMETRLSL